MTKYEYDQDILDAPRQEILDKLLDMRAALRKMEAENGGQVCYLDLERLYEKLPEYKPRKRKLLPEDQHLANCRTFHRCLQNMEYEIVDELYGEWDKLCPYERKNSHEYD
jgi:hypothetical protein